MMHPSGGFQEFHMEKNVFPPLLSTSSDIPVGDFSRKNNFSMSNQPGNLPASVKECGFSRGPNDSLHGSCRNNIVNGFASNQPEENLNFRYPHDKNGYWNQNNFVAPWQPNEKNLHETRGNSVYTSSVGQLQPVQWEEPSLAKVLNVLPSSFGHVNQFKSYESSAPTEKSHIEGHVEGFPRYGQSGHLSSNFNASEDNPNPSCKKPVVEKSQSRSLDLRMSFVGVEGQACFRESSNFESSCRVQEQSGAYRGLDTYNPSIDGHVNQFKSYESSAPTEKSHIEGHVEGFPRYGQSGHLSSNFNASEDNPNPSYKKPVVEKSQSRSLDPRMSFAGVEGQACFQESSNVESSCRVQEQSGAYRGLDSRNPSIDGRQLPGLHKEHVNHIFVQSQLQINNGSSGSLLANNAVKGDAEIEKTLSSTASSLMQPLKEETSAKNNEELTSSIKADDIASKATEKLWNGTLQLTSSVKLLAAAYFKSGDKMPPDIYWSDTIEVKGKVRLEAFEKYIQDLPRSRNRGLMVMSLCLTEGSSKDGLKGMNEVVKKYKDGNRIGFAHLSPGVDVYICSNNETIMTILAKNGFFKGMVAVQDYQDSLLGCVVWRKNTSFDPCTRKLGNESLSGHPSSSPSNSNPEQVAGSTSSSAKPGAEAIQPVKVQATSGVIGNNSGESKNVEPSVHPEVGNSSSSPSPRASSSFPPTVDGQAFPTSDLHTIHSIVKQLSEIEASIFKSLGIQKLQGNMQLLKTILPPTSEAVKQPVPPPEDDDLPEYDFGAAVPHASTSNPLESIATIKKLNDEGFRPSNELVASSQMCVEAQKDVYGGPLPQKRKVHAIGSLPVVEERAIMATAVGMGNSNTMLGSKPKNLFDEDDMPEWLPPDMEHFKPSTDQTTRLSFVSNTFRPPHLGAANPSSSHVPTSILPGPPSDGQHYPVKPLPCTSHHPTTVTAQVALPPAPPQPPRTPADGYMHGSPGPTTKFSLNPARRPEHRPYNAREPINRNRWSHR